MQTFLIDCAMFVKDCAVYTLDEQDVPMLYDIFSIDDIGDFIKFIYSNYEECKILLTGAPSSYLNRIKNVFYEQKPVEFNKLKNIIVEIV